MSKPYNKTVFVNELDQGALWTGFDVTINDRYPNRDDNELHSSVADPALETTQ